MYRLVALLLAALLVSAESTPAGTFQDSFSTTPFGTPKRWCERWHHVHWDSINLLVSGVNGASCPSPPQSSGCCVAPKVCGPTDLCENGGVDVHFLITVADYSGLTRTANAKFAVQAPFEAGEHAALYSVTHPHCHAGFQAFMLRRTEGDYAFQIAHTDDADQFGRYPECGDTPNSYGVAVGNLPIVTTTLPRYRIQLTTKPDPDLSFLIVATATLIDVQTGVTLATIHYTSLKPSWYNNEAKRYGMGGVERTTTAVIPWDDFVGTHQ